MAQLLSLPGPISSTYYLAESAIAGQQQRDEKTLFDGVDGSLAGLAQLAGPQAPKELVDGVATISAAVQSAQKSFDSDNDRAVLQPLVTGLRALRALRTQLRTMNGLSDSGRYEIDYRLGQKERELAVLHLVAFISLQLGIINLLPIPMLDGGHIFILMVEAILRRDLSAALKERVMQAGLIFLLLFAGIVIYFDTVKLNG